jgi:hypothetical protein
LFWARYKEGGHCESWERERRCVLEFPDHYSYWPLLEILAASTYMSAWCHNPDDHNLTTAVELPFKVDLNVKLRIILNGGNLTPKLLTWDRLN